MPTLPPKQQRRYVYRSKQPEQLQPKPTVARHGYSCKTTQSRLSCLIVSAKVSSQAGSNYLRAVGTSLQLRRYGHVESDEGRTADFYNGAKPRVSGICHFFCSWRPCRHDIEGK